MTSEFQVSGKNSAALFSLKLHRGDGMTLVAMNWKEGTPPKEFVGFAIEYKEPKGDRFYALKNRLAFPGPGGKVDPNRMSTLRSPIQKFRWVHFPRDAELEGEFGYRVSPVFMNEWDELSYGEPQHAAIELRRETYPGQLNISYTRGFVSSQAFVDRYESAGKISTLLPKSAAKGLSFVPTHPKAKDALAWMGFEARHAILEALDQAISAGADVRVVAYDLSEPDVVSRLEKLGNKLKIIIDDSREHKKAGSGENQAAERLSQSAGSGNVKRHHMGSLQHNKTIVIDGPNIQKVVCGSTNFTWRGFFVQSNNALVVDGPAAVQSYVLAFDGYWASEDPDVFGNLASAEWADLGLAGVDAKVAFSPHSRDNALLNEVAADIGETKSSLFFSLAFLHQTPGSVTEAIKRVVKDKEIFVYGISDKEVGGIDVQLPDGKVAPVFPAELAENLPQPFKKEPTAGNVGNRMHHKFIVIDFDKPTARVYTGSYNFSDPADGQNGENLLLFKDRRVAVSYMIEAIRIFDHYHFRIAQKEAATAKTKLQLARPPRATGDRTWWAEDYEVTRKIKDRLLFA
ncbi:phospholipase D-like domain-containing protein [Rhizobium sp. Root1204]|uniref:phospholipase D-like domain-containing protein n=1 Tax=Rhizobium sp. Root1204 TaxID=1736428 RepID=UPI000713EDFC|nr:phospholipase D-like domain-containing protein [Rhizobium sp. Root1204]KQV41224.1 phospholipase [Rhizobium sp. Root1204]